MHNTTTFNYVGKEGQVRVDQEVRASVGIPVVGDAKAGYEQSFTTKGYGVAKTIQEPHVSLDVDVTKVNLGAKFILGVEGELNYDWTSENTFTKIWEKIEEWWNK